MYTGVSPLLLSGSRAMPRAPGGEAAIVALADETQRHTGGSCLFFETQCLWEPAFPRGGVATASCLCLDTAIGLESRVSTGITPVKCAETADFSGATFLGFAIQPRIVLVWMHLSLFIY